MESQKSIIQEQLKDKAVERALQSFVDEYGIDDIKSICFYNQLRLHFECLFEVGYYYGKRQTKHQRAVAQYKNGECVATYPSVTIAARILGVDKSTISKHCKGKIKMSKKKGNTFKFAEDEK